MLFCLSDGCTELMLAKWNEETGRCGFTYAMDA